MKNGTRRISSLTLLLALCMTLATAAPQMKESNTEFGKYNIEASSNCLHVDGQDLETFQLNYSNFEQPIQIGILKTKKCKNFVVRTKDGLEVLYVCKKQCFGVNKMDKDYSTGKKSSTYKIDRTAYLHQRVITTQEKTDKQLMELIACYLPLLIDKA